MDTKKLIGTIIGVTMFAVLIAGATFAWLTFGTNLGENEYVGQTMNFIVDYTKGSNVNYLPILDSKMAKPGTHSDNGGVGMSADKLGANEASGLVVVLKKNTGSTDGHAVISLTTESNTALTRAGVVRWAICRDTDVETEAGGSISATQIDDVCGSGATGGQPTDFSKALNTGIVSAQGTIVLLNDAILANGQSCQGSTIAAATQVNTTFYSDDAYTTIKANQTCPVVSANSAGTTVNSHMIETDGVSYFVYFWLDGETIKNEHLDDQYGSDGSTIENNLYQGFIHASANQLQN